MEPKKVKRPRSLPRISPTTEPKQIARAVSCRDCPAVEDCRYHRDAKRIAIAFPTKSYGDARRWSEALAPFCRLFTHMKSLQERGSKRRLEASIGRSRTSS